MVKIKVTKKEEIREIAEAIRKTLKEREQLDGSRSPPPEGCKIYVGPTNTTTTTMQPVST